MDSKYQLMVGLILVYWPIVCVSLWGFIKIEPSVSIHRCSPPPQSKFPGGGSLFTIFNEKCWLVRRAVLTRISGSSTSSPPQMKKSCEHVSYHYQINPCVRLLICVKFRPVWAYVSWVMSIYCWWIVLMMINRLLWIYTIFRGPLTGPLHKNDNTHGF